MKPNIHPQTNPVVFVDTTSGAEFVTTSTLSSDKTRDIDGVPHCIINVEISSASHPFFTGEARFVDTAGRVDKFKEKLERVKATAEKRKGKKAKQATRAAAKKQDTPSKATKVSKGTKAGKETKTEVTQEVPVVEESKIEEATEK
ncbi:MAG: hypothetical protein COV60_03150 [Candidatus Magasanikbacteria bacterium CG11_big_fil_rev_8_21_14_0_20_43_7]|uniref:50S ribosomal protein L31 n=1 Tax=Candidatus Magasanikbacteria bacterium CG11_big_fil_rev_8_21_14_0_20_43_7 TaxID=1974654 RepID=A0A2H0N1X6_9BACT|nr:MAG: hypothetical protein COV60_03150 [Candidatus Magasanikbacteria bacterium CG11_big_fil_rev_8_21_14_0_20_43_7]